MQVVSTLVVRSTAAIIAMKHGTVAVVYCTAATMQLNLDAALQKMSTRY
jgi:hypothetical protein